MLISSLNLYKSYLNISWLIFKYCQILLSTYEHMVLIEHIHHLEDIYKLNFFPCMYILACYHIANQYLPREA